MNNAKALMWRAIFILILIFGGGWFLGGVLNLASIVSPELVSKYDCPEGSRAIESWVQQSWDQPGQKTLTVTCHDKSGGFVTPLSDRETLRREYMFFYPAGVTLMAILVTAWFVTRWLRGMRQAQASPTMS